MLLLVSVFLFSSVIFAQEAESKLIESVDIQGNRRLSDSEILTHIKVRPGDKFDKNQVDKDLVNLLKLGWFDKSSTKVLTEPGYRGGVDVIFEVKELPIINKISYETSDYFTEEEIIAELERQKIFIKAGDVFDLEKIRDARKAVYNYVTSRGFDRPNIEIFEEEKDVTSVNITLVIRIE